MASKTEMFVFYNEETKENELIVDGEKMELTAKSVMNFHRKLVNRVNKLEDAMNNTRRFFDELSF
jgi:hypothetical protein